MMTDAPKMERAGARPHLLTITSFLLLVDESRAGYTRKQSLVCIGGCFVSSVSSPITKDIVLGVDVGR